MGKKNDFLSLQRKWYLKLARSGFKDIENKDGSVSQMDLRNARVVDFTAVQTYFSIAGQFLHSHKFKKKDDKLVWELHAMGQSLSEIAKKLGFGIKKVRISIQRTKRLAKL